MIVSSQKKPRAKALKEDVKKIIGLVLARSNTAEIEAMIGRKLKAKEVALIRRTRAAMKVKSLQSKSAGPKSGSERVEELRDRHRRIKRAKPKDKARRLRLEKRPIEWLKYYLHMAYPRPFQEAHLAIIDGAMNAQATRGRFVIAGERGLGKSSVLWGLILLFKLAGMELFPVAISFSDTDCSRALEFWTNALSFNERLLEDYPEYCQPFSWAKGSGFKLSGSLWGDNGKPTGAMFKYSQNMIVFPDNLGVIGCESINGNPRGLNQPCPDGSIIRPTLAMVDDPQSRGVAKSPTLVLNTIDIIDSDIGGLGEAGTKLPMLMSGNCIKPYDVLHHYLHHPEWQAVRVPRITTWPDGFEDSTSVSRIRWEEWNRIRLEGQQERDKGKADKAFYAAHKADMTRGMKVSNLLSTSSRKNTQVDPLYAAMESYYVMGHHAFYAERQQEPVAQISSSFEIRVDLILSRKSGYARLHAPDNSVMAMGIDINYVGFNYAVVGADPMTQTRKVAAHGLWPASGGLIPKGATDEQACLIIRRGMAKFTREVIDPMLIRTKTDTPLRIQTAAWDASNGKWQDAIAYAVKEIPTRVQMWPLKAFGSKYYKPRASDLRQGMGWHVSMFPRIGRCLVINADHWREMMQRGFVVEPSEAGALSLYEPDVEGAHRALAAQIVGERLLEKIVTDKGEYYNWLRTPGILNDRADALVYACALTGFEGIGEMKFTKPKRRAHAAVRMVQV